MKTRCGAVWVKSTVFGVAVLLCAIGVCIAGDVTTDTLTVRDAATFNGTVTVTEYQGAAPTNVHKAKHGVRPSTTEARGQPSTINNVVACLRWGW